MENGCVCLMTTSMLVWAAGPHLAERRRTSWLRESSRFGIWLAHKSIWRTCHLLLLKLLELWFSECGATNTLLPCAHSDSSGPRSPPGCLEREEAFSQKQNENSPRETGVQNLRGQRRESPLLQLYIWMKWTRAQDSLWLQIINRKRLLSWEKVG